MAVPAGAVLVEAMPAAQPEERPVQPEERPAVQPEERPAVQQEERPAVQQEERPVQQEERPAQPEERPAQPVLQLAPQGMRQETRLALSGRQQVVPSVQQGVLPAPRGAPSAALELV